MARRLRGFALAAASIATPAFAQYTAKEWPEGPMKQRFAATCGGCHDINRVRVGYTPEGWHTVVRMMQNMGAPVPAEEWAPMTEYLIKNFPERPRPPPAIIAGPVKATIKLWDVPTHGSRPHDPLAAKDGAIWWTGQLANKLGRLDPKTGAIREYPLKTPHTGPHGLAEDKDGNIWFTGNNAGLIGKLDPKTGIITEYQLPDPKREGPAHAQFRPDGILWFTVQQANMIGRLDPKTGEIKLVTSPTPKSRPYGLAINSKGVPCVRRVRRQQDRHHRPEDAWRSRNTRCRMPGARPRRIALVRRRHRSGTPISRAAMLGRLDLATGEVKEWPSPSGPKSQPYGIVFTKGALWYNESARQAEHHRALRSEDGEIPELGDPRRRRHRAQHGCDAATAIR